MDSRSLPVPDGLDGVRVDDPEDLADAWQRAFTADRPYVIDVVTDPDVPLLPPFPAGASKLASMHRAVDAEPGGGAAALLRRYAEIEGGADNY